MLKRIWHVLGDNWLLIIAAIAALAWAQLTQAETLDQGKPAQSFCAQHLTAIGYKVGGPVTILNGDRLQLIFDDEVIVLTQNGLPDNAWADDLLTVFHHNGHEQVTFGARRGNEYFYVAELDDGSPTPWCFNPRLTH